MKKVETRGRKFDAEKYVNRRALEIANNAAVAHNTNPINIAQRGIVRPEDFMPDATEIAMKEAQAKQERKKIKMYKLHTVPKKSMGKILDSLALFITSNNIVKLKSSDLDTATIIHKAAHAHPKWNEALAMTAFNTRFTTGSSRSTERETLAAIPKISKSGRIPRKLKDKAV